MSSFSISVLNASLVIISMTASIASLFLLKASFVKLKSKQGTINNKDEDFSEINELQPYHVERFGRQLVLKEFGSASSQIALLRSSVLVIGAGGLGSSILPLLSGMGVGRIGIIDGDVVEVSNLHRQMLHTEKSAEIKKKKSISAAEFIKERNSKIKIDVYEEMFSSTNAIDLIKGYDVIVDATDNLAARYLISDACVLVGGKPLISGAAQGLEGQVTVYDCKKYTKQLNSIGRYGCYRCTFPEPVPEEYRTSCNDSGVLGPVPSLIGSLQAYEVVKVILTEYEKRNPTIPELKHKLGDPLYGRLLMFDFRDISNLSTGVNGITSRFRYSSSDKCIACGMNPTIQSMDDSLTFCIERRLLEWTNNSTNICTIVPKPKYNHQSLPYGVSITAQDYAEMFAPPESLPEKLKLYHHFKHHILIDVRSPNQFSICRIPNAVNIPLETLSSNKNTILASLQERLKNNENQIPQIIVFICRRGVLSSHAAKMFLVDNDINSNIIKIHHIQGGLESWANYYNSFEDISSNKSTKFPLY